MSDMPPIKPELQGKRAIQSILIEHLDPLRAYIRLNAGPLIRANEDTSDIAQSVCREVLQRADGLEYQGTAAFRRWLFTTALHKIMSRTRHLKAERRDATRVVRTNPEESLTPYATLFSPSRLAIGREAVQQLESAFDSLSDLYRQAITLKRIANLDYREIGLALGKSPGAARNLVYRGLAKLSEQLGPEAHGNQ